MIPRLLITAVILLALVCARAALAWIVARRRRRPAVDLVPPDLRGPFRLILAFSTPGCTLCQTAQTPILEELVRQYSDRVIVRHVDATAAPALVNRFWIFTVPSTVIIDDEGNTLAINHGLTGAAKLARQLHLHDEPRALTEKVHAGVP